MDVYMVAATQVFHFYRCKCSERGEQDAFLVALTKGTHTLVSSKGRGGGAFCSLNKVSKLRQEYTTHTVGPSSWGPRTPKNKPFRRSFTYTDIIAGDIPYKPTESQPKALLKDTDSTAVRFESQLMVPPEKRQHDRRVLFPSLCCVERCAWWNSPSPFPSEKPLLKLFKRSFNVFIIWATNLFTPLSTDPSALPRGHSKSSEGKHPSFKGPTRKMSNASYPAMGPRGHAGVLLFVSWGISMLFSTRNLKEPNPWKQRVEGG